MLIKPHSKRPAWLALFVISLPVFAESQGKRLEVLEIQGIPPPDYQLTASVSEEKIRSVYRLELNKLDQPATRIEDLAFSLPGVQQGIQDSGFSTSLLIRGFPVNRPDYNGLPDVQRLFVRDLHTVEAIEVLSGPDAIMRGLSSPGGSIRYIGKQPQFEQRTTLGIQASSYAPFYEHNGTRLTLDTTGPLSDQLAYRVVAVSQDIDLMPNKDSAAQHGHLLSGLTWQYAALGELRLEAEYQQNRQPYLFGTVINSQGQPLYDRYFAAPDQASKRQYQRYAVYWSQGFELNRQDSLSVNARYAQASVDREDELIGFWSRLSDEELAGYYTRVEDDFKQTSYQLSLTWQREATAKHQAALTLDQHDENFTLDRDQALWDFAADDWAFYLSPTGPYQILSNQNRAPITLDQLNIRSWQDRNKNTTRGLALAYQLSTHLGWRALDGSIGLRHNTFEQRFARDSERLPVVMDAEGFSWQWGLNLELTEQLQAHLAQGLSRQVAANGRRNRNGDFLSPEENLLTELGFSLQSVNSAHLAGASLYHLKRSKMAEADLRLTEEEKAQLGFTPFSLTGSQTSVGIESQYRYQQQGWDLRVNASYLVTADDQRAGSGKKLPGIASTLLSGYLAYQLPLQNTTELRPWYSSYYIGKRYADTANQLPLDAFTLHNLGISWARSNTQISLALTNLLDEKYVSYVSSVNHVYQGERRRIWLALEQSF